MVDKKTGLKPKKAKSEKEQVKPNISKKEKEEVKVDTQVVEEPAAEEASKIRIKPTAKAGKHSAKAIKEVEAEKARQERKKAAADSKQEKPKQQKKPARSRLERAGKKYRKAAELIEKNKLYPLPEALELAVKTSITKFDATVELHINLGVDPKQADQNVRDSVTLPAGSGKVLRVAVFAEGDNVVKAKAAGADIAGENDFLAQLDKEQIDFDILITSPNLMARLGKYAKLLGPKGLMPNPKSGTITADIPKAVKEAKAGKTEYRVDQAGIVHLGIGRVSFGADKLRQNADAVIASIKAAKPASLKGIYISSAYVATTMGPGIKISL